MRTLILCVFGGALVGGCSILRSLDDLAGAGGGGDVGGSPPETGGGGLGGTEDGGNGGMGGGGGPSAGGGCPTFADLSPTGGGSIGPAANASTAGCADGTREVYTDAVMYPDIAGCSGGFETSGITPSASFMPQCNHASGNDGDRPNGHGCSVADLCAPGWHVCMSPQEVDNKSGGTGCDDSEMGFWTTRQGQNNAGACVMDGQNNLVGCGQLGDMPAASCAPLTRRLREVICNESCAWECDGNNIFFEATVVRKIGPDDGGAICCKD